MLETHPASEGSWYDMVVKLQAKDQHELNKAVHAIKGIARIAAVVTNIAYGELPMKKSMGFLLPRNELACPSDK